MEFNVTMILVGALFIASYGTWLPSVEALNVHRIPEVVLFPAGVSRRVFHRPKNVPSITGLPTAGGQTGILLKSPPPLERVRFPFSHQPMMPFGPFPPFFRAGPDVGNVVIYRIAPKTSGEKPFTASSQPHLNDTFNGDKPDERNQDPNILNQAFDDNEGHGQRDRYGGPSDNDDGLSRTSQRERNTNFKIRKPFSSSVDEQFENRNMHDYHGQEYKGHENQGDHHLKVGERRSETDWESNYPRGYNGNRRTNYPREGEGNPWPVRGENFSGAINDNNRNNHYRRVEKRPTPEGNDRVSKPDNADRRSHHRERERPTHNRNDNLFGVDDATRGIDYHREGERSPISDRGDNFFGANTEESRKNPHRDGERRRILDRGESFLAADNDNRGNNYPGEGEIRPTSSRDDNFSVGYDNSRRNNYHRKRERVPPPDQNANISEIDYDNRRNNHYSEGGRRHTPDRDDNFSKANINNRRNNHHTREDSRHLPEHGDNFSDSGNINLRNDYHRGVGRRPTGRDENFAEAHIDNRRSSYNKERERPTYNQEDSHFESINGNRGINYNQEQERPSTDNDLAHNIPGTNHNSAPDTNLRNEQREKGVYRLGDQNTSSAPFQKMEQNHEGETYHEEPNTRPNRNNDRNHYGVLNNENDRTWDRGSAETVNNKKHNYNGNSQGENDDHQNIRSLEAHIPVVELVHDNMRNEDTIPIQSSGDIVGKESDKDLIRNTQKPMINNNREHMEFGPEQEEITINHDRNVRNSKRPSNETPQNNEDTIVDIEQVSRVGEDDMQKRKSLPLIDKRKDYKYINRRRDLPSLLSD